MTLACRRHRGSACFWCALLVVVLWPVAADAQPWVATDIFEIAGVTVSEARANAVSDTGQVVGSYTTPGAPSRGFSWTRNGGFVDLGTLGGSGSTEAWGVNNAGQVVGYSSTAGGAEHAFLWSQSTGMLDIGTLGGAHSIAYDINNMGQIVGGSYLTGNTAYHAFVYTGATGPVDLGTLGGSYSFATAIDDSGRIVGESAIAGGQGRAFSWTGGGGMVDLGTLGGTFSSAQGVNQTGHITGNADTTADAAQLAFRWTSGGGMVSLGTLAGASSWGYDVNDAGMVVGASYTTGNGAYHAFARAAGGTMADLGTLGGAYSEATAVNNAGQVVGWAHTAGNLQRAVIWSGPWKDLAVNFGPGVGVWALRQTSWTQVHGLSPELMASGDLDGNGLDDLVLDFGSGVGAVGVDESRDLAVSELAESDAPGDGGPRQQRTRRGGARFPGRRAVGLAEQHVVGAAAPVQRQTPGGRESRWHPRRGADRELPGGGRAVDVRQQHDVGPVERARRDDNDHGGPGQQRQSGIDRQLSDLRGLGVPELRGLVAGASVCSAADRSTAYRCRDADRPGVRLRRGLRAVDVPQQLGMGAAAPVLVAGVGGRRLYR